MVRRIVIGLIVCLLVGAWIAPALAQSGGPLPQEVVHILQRGETLFSVAQRYGLTVDGIAHANGIPDPRQVYVGQQLVIPGIIPGGERGEGAWETVPCVVQAGDTLSSIARRYHTTWQSLAQINGLLSPNGLYVGQIVQTPALVAPADVLVADEESPVRPPVGGGALYIVRSDDTLFHVALRYGISPWMLASANRIANPTLIYPGQELVIPNREPGLLPAPFAFVEVQPLPVAQGMPMVVAVHTTEPVALTGGLFGQDVHFAEEGGVYYGLVGVHAFTEPGLYQLELTAVDDEGRRTAISTGIIVQDGRFGYERIDMPNGLDNMLNPAVIAAERERLNALRFTFTPERHWETPLQRPCVGAISSYFGTHRAYGDGPYTSYHSGVDFRAPTGTPVHTPAGGIVALAEPLVVRGNAVIVDHGWGLLTGYWHLSEINVQVGQQIATGDIIGKVGSTGLSTGAHLHWEVLVGGVSVNGLEWLEELQFEPKSEWRAVGG